MYNVSISIIDMALTIDIYSVIIINVTSFIKDVEKTRIITLVLYLYRNIKTLNRFSHWIVSCFCCDYCVHVQQRENEDLNNRAEFHLVSAHVYNQHYIFEL